MKHWRAVARSINYVRWYWIGNMGGITVIFLAYQVPGLVNREFICLIPILAVTGFVYVLRMRIAALRPHVRRPAT